MKQRLLFISFFLFICSVYGQGINIDSLLNLSKKPKSDSLQLTYYYQITSYYQNNNIALAKKYNDSLFINSRKFKMTRFELLAYSQKGILDYRESDFKQAIETWKEGLKNKKIKHYPIQQSGLLNNIALGYKVLKENDSVLTYMLKAVDLNITNNNEEGLIGNYFSLADFYSSQRDFDNSVINIKKLQEIALRTDNEMALGQSYMILAKICRQEYDFKDSEKYFDKAYEIYNRIQPNNNVFLSALLFESASSTYFDKRYNEAIEKYINIKQEYLDHYNDKDFWISIDGALLNSYNELLDIENGKLIYNSLLNVIKIEGNTYSKHGIVLNGISRYELLTNTHNNNTLKRLEGVLKEKKNNIDTHSISTKNISEYYYRTGDNEKAYLNLIRYDKLRDSIHSMRATTINLSLKRKFNEELKEKENLQLKADNAEQELLTQKANTRNWLLALGILALAISIFFIYKRYKAEAKAKRVISQQKTQIEKLQKEFHHRLKNDFRSINSFISLVQRQFSDTEFLERLNELKNRVTSMFKVHEILLQEEDVTQVKAQPYLLELSQNVEDKYSNENIKLICNIDDTETIVADKAIPFGIVLNEFVTNSFKYAFDEKGGEITIDFKSDVENHHLTLKDNGRGLPKDFNIDNLRSLGMSIIPMFADLHDGRYKIDGSNGVSLTLILPKKVA